MQSIDEGRCESMTQIGDAIKHERENLKWSQERLAREASKFSEKSIPTITVGNIERGTIVNPGIDKVGPIADALGVTVDHLRHFESSHDKSTTGAR
ncbi:MAG: helix-turn-helix domain-containing protein [Actinobacteria bacterium]|nr:helix-turn-helix domain-containing protein [Actinomycetota bacterium]